MRCPRSWPNDVTTSPGSAGAGLYLGPRLDLAQLSSEFSNRGHVVIPRFLDDAFAARLYERLLSWSEWALVTRIQGEHRTFDAAGMDALDPARRAAFDELVAAEARNGFQYLYERYPLFDHGRAGRLTDPVLAEAFAMLGHDSFLDFAREVTGVPQIRLADGQVTRYRRGHFLTLHDDHAEEMQRVAAYVLNLTPEWAADFGGQLQFADAQGRVQSVVTPSFNTLTVFAVPSPHLVSSVAPFVDRGRYAITGWFRTG